MAINKENNHRGMQISFSRWPDNWAGEKQLIQWNIFITEFFFTRVLLNYLFLYFIQLKLELLTQIPASKDKKYIDLWKMVTWKM